MCGSSNTEDGRQYIDIGFEIDYYGVVYFCTHCVSEIAMAIGYRSSSLFKVIEEENLEYANTLSEFRTENVKLRVALSQLDFLGSSGNIHDDFDPGIKEPVKGKGSDDTKPVEQTNESGRANVPKTGKSKSTELDLENFDV